MTQKERQIADEIIERIRHTERMNESWLETIWGNKKSSAFIKLVNVWLYRKEYSITDYFDGRKNLIHFPKYCEYTGKKIDKKLIRKSVEQRLWT